jgi:hypothetical protein
LPTGKKAKDISKNIEQTIPATFIQLADFVIVSKLSEYNHSVWGQGRQHVTVPTAEQNLPDVTVMLSVEVQNRAKFENKTRQNYMRDNLQPPVDGKRLASKKGVGQAPWPTTEEFDIFQSVYVCIQYANPSNNK